MLLAVNSTVENCSGIPNVKVVVLIVEEIAFLDFLKRKNVGLPLPSTLYTVTSVGSPDEDTLKSTGS